MAVQVEGNEDLHGIYTWPLRGQTYRIGTTETVIRTDNSVLRKQCRGRPFNILPFPTHMKESAKITSATL